MSRLWQFLFSFEGRINRAKMWLFYFLSFFGMAPAFGMEIWLYELEPPGNPFQWPTTALGAAVRIALFVWVPIFLYVYLAVIVKRLHDRGKSAAWLILFFSVPVGFFVASRFLGWPPNENIPGAAIAMTAFFVVALANNLWYLLELLAFRGTRGPNRFGPDPIG